MADMSQEMYDEVKKIVVDTLKEYKILKADMAKVISYSAPNASIQLSGSTVTMNNIKNLSGSALAPNDLVVVHMLNGDYSNLHIAHKII